VHRQTQVVQELMSQETVVAILQLVSSAKVSLREDQRMAVMMPGLMTASQEETHTNKKTDKLEPVVPIQESELSARDSLKRRRQALLNQGMAAMMHGLILAMLTET